MKLIGSRSFVILGIVGGFFLQGGYASELTPSAEEALANLTGSEQEQKAAIEKIVLKELAAKGFTRPLHLLRAKRLQNRKQAQDFIGLIRKAQTGPELNISVSRSGIPEDWAAPAETAQEKAKFFPGPIEGEVPPTIRKVVKWFNAENQPWAKEGVLDLGLLKDRTVIVDFWATWCFPCRISMSSLRKLHENGLGEKAIIIGVTDLDDHQSLEKIESYLNKAQIHFPIAVLGDSPETDQSLIVEYGVFSIPRTFLIGPKGRVAWQGNPLADEAAFSAKLLEIGGIALPKQPSPEEGLRDSGIEPRPINDSKP